MGFITVERHVFYLRPKKYETTGQHHMWVENLRLPWGQGDTARTVGYLDDAQFGALAGKVTSGRTADGMAQFFLGKSYKHPNLMVARVTASDFLSRNEISEHLFNQFKHQLKDLSSLGQGDIPEDEDEKFLTHAQRMARYRTGGQTSGVRHVQAPLRSAGDMYRPHYSKHYFNTAWLLVDPTRPGRQMTSKDRVVRIAKQELRGKFSQVLFPDQRVKKMDTGAIVVLGVGYMLQYWQKRLPPQDVRWLESVQQRVRKHLGAAMKVSTGRVDATQTWYAMGKHQMPPRSTRFKTTEKGRVRRYTTFRPGIGITTTKPTDEFRLRPLFTVKARNIEAAKDAGERYIARLIKKPSTAEQGYDLEASWYASGKKIVSLAAVRMLRKQ